MSEIVDELLPTIDWCSSGDNRGRLTQFVMRSLQDSSFGCCLIKGFPINGDLPSIHKSYLDFSTQFGEPVSHDENNSLIWDIKKSQQNTSSVQTYSEHDGDAELHTDSQYRDIPEDYFGLLTIKKADCGGGESSILSVTDLIKEIESLSDGAELLSILSNQSYPFIVPTVFNRGHGDDPEFVYGSIFSGNTIRFRVDTVLKAIPHHQESLSKIAIDAFYRLKDIIDGSKFIKRFHLEPGDLLFVNNKTTLHGRTAFSDSSRHLLRVRLRANIV